MRHKHRHKPKDKTTSISYGRTKANSKENSFCLSSLTSEAKLSFVILLYVASKDQVELLGLETAGF